MHRRALSLAKVHLDAAPKGLQHYAGCWHNGISSGYGYGIDAHPVC
jgi:hypothetical protein